MEKLSINIAMDFSKTPGVRYKSEGGGFSGEEFRNDYLLPKLKEAIERKIKLEINLDKTAGLGTSFLEESFGGLIREDNIDYNDIKDTIEFISEENPDYIDEINGYLNDAYENKNK